MKKILSLACGLARRYQLHLVSAMLFSSLPAYAQSSIQGNDAQLVQVTANQLARDYQKGGINSIADDIQICYAHATDKVALKQCLALDIGGLFISEKLVGEKEVQKSFPYMLRSVASRRIDSYAPIVFKTKTDFANFAKSQGNEILYDTLDKIHKKS